MYKNFYITITGKCQSGLIDIKTKELRCDFIIMLLRDKNIMKVVSKKILLLAMALVLFVSCMPFEHAKAFAPPTETVKIGLYFGSQELEAANLQNCSGYGEGYDFGYFDSSRNFVNIGASTGEKKISMLMDRNMYYLPGTNTYHEGTVGDTVIGCFHIQLATQYETYEDARAAADTFTSVNAFVKYSSGVFYVCAGAYTSQADAQAAGEALGIQQDWSVTSGTSFTITVVATGTDRILFEYEYGREHWLAVVPRQTDPAVKTRTYFKNVRYYGAFQYARLSGDKISVVNVLNVEDYVKGVITREMNAAWPREALKAQAICARTFVMTHLNYHGSFGFDLCTTIDCQVYGGIELSTANSDAAVDETAGQYLVYNDKLCETYYYSSNGGASEDVENVWSSRLEYLRGVQDPYEAAVKDRIPNYEWTVTYTAEQLKTILNNKGYNCSNIVDFRVAEYTSSGNVLKIVFTDDTGRTFTFSKEKVRILLGLRSMRYTINGASNTPDVYINSPSGAVGWTGDMCAVGSSGTDKISTSDKVYAITGTGAVEEVNTGPASVPNDGKFVINGSGYGHNIGMSQWGAYSMASVYGLTCKDILEFYYTGAKVVQT